MQFTKPQAAPEKNLEVSIIGDAVWVTRCDSHPQNDEIRLSLRNAGWEIEFNNFGWIAKGFTPRDRKVLRRELVQAYQAA